MLDVNESIQDLLLSVFIFILCYILVRDQPFDNELLDFLKECVDTVDKYMHICCSYLNRWVPRKAWLALIMTSCLVFVTSLFFIKYDAVRSFHRQGMEETIAVMRTRLAFLESQYRGRQKDDNSIQARVDGEEPVAGYDEPNATYSPELTALLMNIRGSKTSDSLLASDRLEPMKPPFSFEIAPYLLDHSKSLTPNFYLRAGRAFTDIIIGLPHVMRDKETYLFATLESLLTHLKSEEMNFTMIAIMIGETNLTYVIETAHKIEERFPEAIAAGLIDIISPSKHYYPDLDALPQTLGDSLKRVKWRTKQNLDAIFLMIFAYSKCLYYIMIEDDVLVEDNYMTEIRSFTTATTVTNPDWFFIQFSTTGGIGKLFRSTDLIYFMTYVQLFYNNMPIDWLTESYLADRVCTISKGDKECAAAKTKIRPTYKKNLFKHIGLYSSLKGKLQKIKGAPESTLKTSEFFPHNNPPVTHIKCDLSPHEKYSIESAYSGKSFFWGKQPKKGDVIEFWFLGSIKIDKYLIRSGSLKRVKDIISNAVFEILPTTQREAGNFIQIDKFDEFGMVEGHVDYDKFGELVAVRIRFEENSKYWVAITEMMFATAQPKETSVSATRDSN